MGKCIGGLPLMISFPVTVGTYNDAKWIEYTTSPYNYDSHNVRQSCDYHLQSPSPPSYNQSQWVSQQDVENDDYVTSLLNDSYQFA